MGIRLFGLLGLEKGSRWVFGVGRGRISLLTWESIHLIRGVALVRKLGGRVGGKESRWCSSGCSSCRHQWLNHVFLGRLGGTGSTTLDSLWGHDKLPKSGFMRSKVATEGTTTIGVAELATTWSDAGNDLAITKIQQ